MICIWSSWCHCHPIISCSSIIQNSLPFWCRLTQVVLEKRPLNGCSVAVVCAQQANILQTSRIKSPGFSRPSFAAAPCWSMFLTYTMHWPASCPVRVTTVNPKPSPPTMPCPLRHQCESQTVTTYTTKGHTDNPQQPESTSIPPPGTLYLLVVK